ncbi:MAG: hypothetical protein ACJATK_001808 [Paracoccaceae bacterium]|jgi:hypothetical protein
MLLQSKFIYHQVKLKLIAGIKVFDRCIQSARENQMESSHQDGNTNIILFAFVAVCEKGASAHVRARDS